MNKMTEVEKLKAIEPQAPIDISALATYHELMYHTACRYIEANGLWDDFYDNYIEGKEFL